MEADLRKALEVLNIQNIDEIINSLYEKKLIEKAYEEIADLVAFLNTHGIGIKYKTPALRPKI